MVKVIEKKYELKEEDLYGVCSRENPKRNFLFVSKILGKHLDTEPVDILYHTILLGEEINRTLSSDSEVLEYIAEKKEFVKVNMNIRYDNKEKYIFIGFAETATGIGQGVFDRFKNAFFIHTTREKVKNKKILFEFKEEHSHATDHYIYCEEEKFKNQYPIVLIDDELTTGKTNLNIIREINKLYPRKKYIVASYLNWMNKENLKRYKDFEEENNIKIEIVYLLKGEILEEEIKKEKENFEIQTSLKEENLLVVKENISEFGKIESGYILESGIFGIESLDFASYREELEKKVKGRYNKDIIYIGYGEFMYIPTLFAYYNDGIFKTFTRSPIIANDKEGYLIKNKFSFDCILNNKVKMYSYNYSNKYSEIMIFINGTVGENKELLEKLKVYNPKEIRVFQSKE